MEVLAAIQGGAEDGFELGGRSWGSRLIVGTGGFRSLDQMEQALIASGTEIVTVALRRVDPEAEGSVLDVIRRLASVRPPEHRRLLHGTGRGSHREARPGGIRDRVGEARGDRRRPHPFPRCRAAGRGGRDPRRRRLHGAPLHQRRSDPRPPAGGGRLRCGYAARLADRVGDGDPQPVQHPDHRRARPGSRSILDAGIGTASDAALAMELGCDAVLLASSVSRAEDPPGMATAMRAAVEAGLAARQAGRIPRRLHAEASTPLEGRPELS